jgi:hypothetical protein
VDCPLVIFSLDAAPIIMEVSKALQYRRHKGMKLQSYLRKHNLPASVAQRMRIILALADGLSYREIIEHLNTTAPTISLSKRRFAEVGLIGLGSIRPDSRPNC